MVGELEALDKHRLQHFGNLIGVGAFGEGSPDLKVLTASEVGLDDALVGCGMLCR